MRKNVSALTLATLSIGFVALSGCASKMSKSDCTSTDFYQMGLKDGEKGRNRDKFNEAQAQCQGHGVEVTGEKYSYGRKVGLTEFCSKSLAEKDARKGGPNQLCVEEAVPPYMSAYNAELAKVKSSAERDLQNLQKSKGKLDAKEAKLQGEIDRINNQQAPPPASNQ